MKWILNIPIAFCLLLLVACSSSKEVFDANRKYDAPTLKQDYELFRNILEEYHPSLYWFTPKDSMDYFFNRGDEQLNDSLTEPQFRNILLDVITKIRCGHTSVFYSKKYSRYLDTARLKVFPLSFRVTADSMMVIGNINRRDSILKRGTVVRSINGWTTRQLTDTFFNYLVTDAWAVNGKYQTLSSGGNFGVLYRNVFGMPDKLTVGYDDSLGQHQSINIPVYDPLKDTSRRSTGRAAIPAQPSIPRQTVLNGTRNLQIDTTLSSAYMTLNTFSRGNKLKKFFRRSFRAMEDNNIKHLVIDIRRNGGGDAGLSTMLTEFIIDKKFKLADSLYAVRRSGSYNKYIKKHFFYRTAMLFVTKKRKDGKYHFRHFEQHYYKPRKKDHFDGDIYIVTGGNSFSASALFVKAVQHQKNVTIIGEETGGGSYGNTAWMIPNAVLPNTGIRFRLPLFRLVMDKDAVAAGRGIFPDIEVLPTAETIKLGIDPRAEKIKELIISKNKLTQK